MAATNRRLTTRELRVRNMCRITDATMMRLVGQINSAYQNPQGFLVRLVDKESTIQLNLIDDYAIIDSYGPKRRIQMVLNRKHHWVSQLQNLT